ncbi:AraC family transcriptional regulator [Bradyrhizobium sp.]|uniref:AraC family transcriptional regulator n=1 Tax=Bradyrhizobium sp. TaxID=376 RepID=UPI001EC840B1|nr:AraC family transcriptional regulator [Bradyrhizobium sp.]MBV9980454.1 AraC family transcriptional regulator [Bradyrhizobium sp.]
MSAVGKAIWFIETHFADDISLDDVARSAGVSRFYLVRAFGVATGRSVMGYVRGRRLSEAARSLAGGAPDILTVALQAGYGSHEAFTRAFRDQFALTPEMVRAQRRTCNLDLVEPIKLDETPIAELSPVRFEHGRPMLIAGLGERYTWESSKAIPAHWQRLVPYLGIMPRRVGRVTFGVSYNGDDEGNFDYIAGCEVSDFSELPAAFSRLRLGAQKYAVFAHRAHIAEIRRTVCTIWTKWLPESGHEAADAAGFECFGDTFDFRTGQGGLEIWIPIKT